MNAVVKLTEARALGVRLPPHAIDAEQAVLGGLMLAPDRMETVSERLAEADFYRADHRAIFRAMLELTGRGQPVDAVTLGDWFESNGLGEMMGGLAYTVELANSTPSAANILAYAQIVREKSTLRKLIDRATILLESAYAQDGNAVDLVDANIAALMAMQKTEARAEYTLRQAMTMAYQEAQAARERGGEIPGIRTGLTRLDKALGGWHDGDLIVIGARPAMGKTALLLNFVAACPFACGIISAEQPATQIAARIMSIKSRVSAELMRTGRFEVDDLRRLEHAVADLADRTCLIYDRSAPTIADVSRMARKWMQQSRIRALFVDYTQRIEAVKTSKNANKSERVGEVIRGLKNLARDLEIPVIALAQVGRQADGRQPTMGDLSDSSEIEKEADQVITLDRPSEYDDNASQGVATLSIEKNRHGPTGKMDVAWIAESMRFEDLA